MTMDVHQIAFSGIGVPLERLRALQPGAVDTLAQSMETVGQLSPIW
jgi:hypothetical protein